MGFETENNSHLCELKNDTTWPDNKNRDYNYFINLMVQSCSEIS